MAVTWDVVSYDGTKTVGSLSNVITTVNWIANDADGEHTGSSYGSIKLADADPNSFIDLASVTNNNLISWAKAALGSDDVTATEANIAAQIAESKTPTKFSGVPS